MGQANEETKRAATAVLDATGALTGQTGTLQTAVDYFLTRPARRELLKAPPPRARRST